MNEHCGKYSGLIEDLVKGELDEQIAAQTESHVFDCSECRNEYELLRLEKESFAHYMFNFEPPPDSWINFQTRLVEETEITPGDTVAPVTVPSRRKRPFVFNFSPSLAAFAGLLLFLGLGFLLLKTAPIEKDYDKYVAETESRNSQSPLSSGETYQKPAMDLPPKTVYANDGTSENNESLVKNQLLKARNTSLFSKNPLAVETVKIKQKSVRSDVKRKQASETPSSDEARAAVLRSQNLETKIVGQIEKVELLLRSFRNARLNETVEGFDVEYEKRQARKLLDKNALLKHSAEIYGLSYAEELLSRVEAYLLEIANLDTNPSTEMVLDIKERVSTQNIIASLQAYSRDTTQ
jgi:hypothetical protein